MADYFLLIDAAVFETRLRPALAAAWRQRSFAPCQDLCRWLLPAAQAYGERYHAAVDQLLLQHVLDGLPFDRTCLRTLAGEVLLYAAAEIPEFQSCEETLTRLLSPEYDPAAPLVRATTPPIVQAHHGSRDVRFGAAIYRPEHAGLNSLEDVRRLADFLASVQPERWSPAHLAGAIDADEEIAFAREWFPVLAELYRRASQAEQVVVTERIF